MHKLKVLIFMKKSDLRPAGGPAGFCYNIHQEILKQNIDEIVFLPADEKRNVDRVNFYRNIEKHLPKWLNAAQIAYRRKNGYQKMIKNPALYNLNFDDYDAIHFHSTISLFKFRRDIENYRGKIILTTHSPVPQHQEIFSELPTKTEKKIYNNFYSKLDQIDEFAFKRADYIVFPCADAEESYLNNWRRYREIHDYLNENGKLIYIPTGIEPKVVRQSRQEVCAKYSLREDRFIVSYVGRHNKIKGYDLLQQIATNLWHRGNDFSFLICGKESPIRGLNDLRWIEIGWTNDSQSIIAASDVFVLPNRETYFDIIMLEVLSCGRIVVASRTGGNKYFEKIKAKGIFLYDTVEEATTIIEKIATMNIIEKRKLEESNRELFYENFTTDKYIKKYLDFLSSII